jgi:hypothetical protein
MSSIGYRWITVHTNQTNTVAYTNERQYLPIDPFAIVINRHVKQMINISRSECISKQTANRGITGGLGDVMRRI